MSSLDSALTELTDSEDGGSELSFGSTLSELTDTDDDATAPSEIPRRSTASPPSAGINAPGKAQGIAKVISVASDHERGQKRRKMEPDVTEQRVGKKIRAGETRSVPPLGNALNSAAANCCLQRCCLGLPPGSQNEGVSKGKAASDEQKDENGGKQGDGCI